MRGSRKTSNMRATPRAGVAKLAAVGTWKGSKLGVKMLGFAAADSLYRPILETGKVIGVFRQ